MSNRPPPLSGSQVPSYAYDSLKDRFPVTICRVIDYLYKNGLQDYSLSSSSGDRATCQTTKAIIANLTRLRYEVQTNKILTPIEDEWTESAKVWNAYLDQYTCQHDSPPRWFEVPWLFAECYGYRRITETVLMATKSDGKPLDLFAHCKRQDYEASKEMINKCIECCSAEVVERSAESFERAVVRSLWANRCDLSLTSASPIDELTSPVVANVLANDASLAWAHLDQLDSSVRIVDIVLDNCGLELVSDLCLADYLIRSKLATQVRFRLKDQPWFVSDVTMADFESTIASMKDNDATLAMRWHEYLERKVWTVHADPFWAYPHFTSDMKSVAPKLYADMSEANLIVFKGDLNYRKLVSDLAWPPSTPLHQAVQPFDLGPILTLRTLKSEVVCSLEDGVVAKVAAKDARWMVSGQFGVIQFVPRCKEKHDFR